MIPFKLLLKFTLIVGVTSWFFGDDKIIKCVKCGGGNFRHKQYLFQSPGLSVRMAWMFAWEKTDCHTGNFTVVDCPTSCITVVTEKDFQDHNGYKYDGIMMDCSKDLIHYSIDLPSEINFREYNGDEVFSAIRSHHNITYMFSSESVENVTHIVNLPISSMPKSLAPKTIWDTEVFTIVFLGFCAFAFLSILFFSCQGFCIWCCCNESSLLKDRTTYHKEPSIEMESLQECSFCSQSILNSDSEKSQIFDNKLDNSSYMPYPRSSDLDNSSYMPYPKSSDSEESADDTPILTLSVKGSPV